MKEKFGHSVTFPSLSHLGYIKDSLYNFGDIGRIQAIDLRQKSARSVIGTLSLFKKFAQK
jgi:hypothetical protein